MTEHQKIRLDPEQMRKVQERLRPKVLADPKAQLILIAYAVVATGLGWGLYLDHHYFTFFFLSTAPLAIISALILQYLRTRN